MEDRVRRAYAAADDERRELERALHDGVQQQLIGIAVMLQLAKADPALVDEVLAEVHRALDDVRALGDRVYPSVLDAQGLAGALGVAELGRFPRDVEAGVYFACRAAGPGARVWEEHGRLHVEVDEDHLEAARDRLAALEDYVVVSAR